MREDEILEKLSQISIFDALKDRKDDLIKLLEIVHRKSYPRGSVIIKEGDVGSDMFIVYRGSVEIQKQTRAGDTYTVVKLQAKDNVFFGEIALVDDDKRSATVIALEDSEFLVLEKQDFLALGKTNPEIALPITQTIARILASRLRKTTIDMLTIFDALVNEIQE
ncbi:MAG TPA: cyclic nucleotide-binding domain-containing protein [Spirochaetales bacterium]|nr:cyclic nucleotide-binding domain-containing protein [Spirochaetales bacterium]